MNVKVTFIRGNEELPFIIAGSETEDAQFSKAIEYASKFGWVKKKFQGTLEKPTANLKQIRAKLEGVSVKISDEMVERKMKDWKEIAAWSLSDKDSVRFHSLQKFAKKIVENEENLKKLKRALPNLKKHANQEIQTCMICSHGDIQNMRLEWKGNITTDVFGKELDSEYDELSYICCNKHEESLVSIETLYSCASYVIGYQELAKVLRRLMGDVASQA